MERECWRLTGWSSSARGANGMRAHRRRFLALLLGLGLSAICLELGSRILGAAGATPTTSQLRDVASTLANPKNAEVTWRNTRRGFRVDNLVLHPYAGFVEDPVSSEAAGLPNGPVNELGFYGSDPLRPTPSGAVRVAVLGGSFAAQMCVRTPEPLIEALRHHPRVGSAAVELDCLALGSAKQPQQLQILSWVASLGTRWDLVLNLDGFNDLVVPVAYNLRKGVYRSYPHNWDRRAAEAPDLLSLRQAGTIALLDEARWGLARRVSGSWASSSSALLLVWHVGDSMLLRRRERVANDFEAASRPRWQRASDRWVASGPRLVPESDDAAMRLAVADWAEGSFVLDALCRGLGAAYVHALQPNQYLEGSQPRMSGVDRAAAVQEDHFWGRIAKRGYPDLIEAGRGLAARGVAFLDLTKAFENESRSYWADPCCHLENDGYALVASHLGEMLRSEASSRQRR